MKPETIATLAVAFVAALAGAYEVPFGGDFAEADADGFPSAWTWHDYPAYLPRADVKVEKGDGGNEIHYCNTRGENGSAIRSKKRIPGKAGDVVTVRLESRGSGKAWFSLYCWTAQNEWSYGLVPHQVDLSDDWKETAYSFTLMGKWTGAFEVAVGIKPGADARFRNVRVTRRLETDSELSMDDYESKCDRPGSPKIVRGDIAPGLQSHTGKGVYTTTRRVDIVPAARHEMPADGKFLTSGLRLYGFGANGAGRLGTAFAHGGERFVFAIAPIGGEIVCRFTGGGRHAVPATTLPADFVFSAAADGTYDLAVTSLANSQTTRFCGRSDFFAGASNGVERTVALFASGGKKAEVTVDNVFLAVSRPERQAEIEYPYLAKPQTCFDPAKEGWPLVFSDEFDGSELDGSKWDLSRPDRSEFPKIENGILRIKTDHVPGSAGKLESSSRLWSVPTFLYGYFEARLKFTTYNGWWAAFWLCSRGTGNSFLDGFEIDIFEDYYMRNPERNKLDHNLHIQGDGPLKSWNYNSTLPGTHRDWYTIGCKWTPFEITYYLNGRAIPSKASHSPYDTVTFDAFRHGTGIVPLHAIVSSQIMTAAYGKHDPDPSEVFPEYFDVDYVRVYGYPGSASGSAPTVAIASKAERKFSVPKGPPVSFKVSAKPAVNTGAKIKAVHLFDGGYYVATKREPPYDFVIPMTEEFFSRTAWSLPGRSGGTACVRRLVSRFLRVCRGRERSGRAFRDDSHHGRIRRQAPPIPRQGRHDTRRDNCRSLRRGRTGRRLPRHHAGQRVLRRMAP